MTKPVKSAKKPSPTDTPTKEPDDNGGKSKISKTDKEYHAVSPHGGEIAKKHEREEQPVHSVKDAPKVTWPGAEE